MNCSQESPVTTLERRRFVGPKPRLNSVLPAYLTEVPLYRRSGYTGKKFSADGDPGNEFSRLPFISKREMRHEFPYNFLQAGTDLEALLAQELVELEHTSGTSEERTPLLLPRGWWGEQEDRALRLNRLVAEILDEFPDARRVTISPPVCGSDICYTSRPTHADRIIGNALFVNLSRHPFLWSEADLARMAAEATEWAPQFLDVDPVYGVLFALYCERYGIRLPSLQFILCSYEFLSGAHRRILRRVFGVPVYNLYGSTETGHLLMENEHGEMVPSLETAFLEVVDPNTVGIGDLAVTTLTNEFMPLIRYRIGDLVEIQDRSSRSAYVVHGRAIDTLRSAEGTLVTTYQIDRCFDGISGVAHYQARQAENGSWRLLFAPERTEPSAAALAELRTRLERLLGAATCQVIQPTDLLTGESSGKLRLTCRIEGQ